MVSQSVALRALLFLGVTAMMAGRQSSADDWGTAEPLVAEVTVIGEAANLDRIPGSGEILDQRLLQQSRVFTLNEAIRKVPGIYARDEEGFGLRPNLGIRGLNPTRSGKILLLEDGLPLTYAPYGDNASYFHPPIDRFERIEVLKGSGQILFGPQTIGGVINYITPKPPSELAGRLAVHGGNRDYGEVHAEIGDTLGDTGYVVNATRKQADGARRNMHFEVLDLNFKVAHQLTPDQAVTVRASYYDEDSQVPYSGLTLAEYQADPRANPFVNDSFQLYRWAGSFTHRLAISDALTLSTSAYYTMFNRDWWRQSSNSSQRPNDAGDPACAGMANLSTSCGNEGRLREFRTMGIEPRFSLRHGLFGMESEADLGMRYHREDHERIQANGDTPNARTAGTGPNAGIVEHNDREVQALAVFVQNRFLAGRWTITPGLRLEQVDYYRRNNLTGLAGRADVREFIPGLGVTYALNADTALFVGVHRGFAPPAVADIVTNSGGSVDLDPELSWNYEIGLRSNARPGINLEATFFRMDFENQVISASLAGGQGATLTNAGETLHQGAELLLQLDSRELLATTYNVFWRAAYTWLPDAKFRGRRYSGVPGFGSTSVSGNRLPYAPEQLLVVAAGIETGSGLHVQAEAVFNAAVLTDDLNTDAVTANGQRGRIPSYTIWNATVNYAVPASGWTLFVTAKNVFDRLYVVDMTRGLIPGAPRLLQGGFSYRF
jgi:Fe(3+) dicitrate transport protein